MYKWVFVVLISIISVYYGRSQNVTKITTENGLPHNVVFKITQDAHGYIWIATEDGLCKYNGYEFSVYRPDALNGTGILDNLVNCIYPDKFGNLWVGTSQGLSKYDPLIDGFEHYLSTNNKTNKTDLDINALAESSNGFIWTGTSNGIVNRINTKTKSISPLSIQNPANKSFRLATTSLLYEDKDNFLWIGTYNQGLLKYNLRSNTFEEFSVENNQLPHNYIYSLIEDKNHNIWIGTYSGLCVYVRKLNKIIRTAELKTIPKEIQKGVIYSLLIDRQGYFWIGTQQDGLYKTKPGAILAEAVDNANNQHFTTGNLANSLSNRSINSIFEDRDNNLWIGTYSGGVNIIQAKQKPFRNLVAELDKIQQFPIKKIWGICQDRDKNLWIGSDGAGLYKWNPANNELKLYKPNPNNANSLSDNAILSAFCDSEGELWFGTYAGGLNHYRKKTDDFESFKSELKSFGANDIRKIFEDGDKNFWLGTNGSGLLNFDRKTRKFQKVGSVPFSDIRSIAEMQGLWFGTFRGSLYNVDGNNTKVYNWLSNSPENQTVSSNVIFDMVPDPKRQKIWFGTRYGGLCVFDLKTQKFVTYNEKDGLSNSTIHAMVMDKNDIIWLSTNKGISRFDPDKNTFINFTPDEGVLSGEFVDGSKCILSDGTICFGGISGLNIFDPEAVETNKTPSEPTIFDFKIYNKSVKFAFKGKERSDNEKYAGFPNKIVLNYDENFLAIDFGVINFSDAQSIQYAFILEGLEGKWNQVGNRRTAYYSAISPGTYTFKVKASYPEQIWSKVTEIKIVIKPPIWKTWWAYLVYFCLSVLLILLFNKYYRQHILLEHELKISIENQELQKKVFLDKMVFYNNISHELRTPLTLILSPLEELLRKAGMDDTIQKQLKLIYDNAQKLFGFINRLLAFSKAEEGSMKLNISYNDVAEHVDKITNSFLPYAAKFDVLLENEKNKDTVLLWYDKEKLEIILYNLLSNAIKFAGKKGKVTIMLEQREDSVIIKVADTGQGIAKENLQKLFQRFYQIGGMQSVAGTGIGLALTKSLVELHKAKIEVDSELNKGTVFTVTFINNPEIYSQAELSHQKPTESKPIAGFQDFEEPEGALPDNDLPAKAAEEKMHQILLVEDNPDMLEYLVKSFSSEYEVITANNGKAALELLESARQPDLIISDVMMPEMDGITFADRVKNQASSSHIPIILLTAKSGLEEKLQGLAAGAIDYISKPFNIEVLKAKVFNLVKESAKMKEYLKKKAFLEPSVIATISAEEKILAKVKQIIEENMINPDFNVNVLVEKMGMSHSTIYNKIKLFTDLSINEFIRSCRIRRAAQLIMDSDMNISEISYYVGFSDIKYFRECFKKEFEMTPSEFKKTKTKAENQE